MHLRKLRPSKIVPLAQNSHGMIVFTNIPRGVGEHDSIREYMEYKLISVEVHIFLIRILGPSKGRFFR